MDIEEGLKLYETLKPDVIALAKLAKTDIIELEELYKKHKPEIEGAIKKFKQEAKDFLIKEKHHLINDVNFLKTHLEKIATYLIKETKLELEHAKNLVHKVLTGEWLTPDNEENPITK
jgi:hypothetical protein